MQSDCANSLIICAEFAIVIIILYAFFNPIPYWLIWFTIALSICLIITILVSYCRTCSNDDYEEDLPL